jgi:ferredoxin hydrogenase large subunit
MQKGKFTANILEGMGCMGGCIGGPATMAMPAKVKGTMIKENMANRSRTLLDAIKENSFAEVDLEVNE